MSWLNILLFKNLADWRTLRIFPALVGAAPAAECRAHMVLK